MSRWTRTYELYRESHPAPGADAGLQIGRTSGGSSTNPHGRTRDVNGERRPPAIVARPTERQDLPLRELGHLLASHRPHTLVHGTSAYRVTGQQVRALATIGAFRAIPKDDLVDRQLLTRQQFDDLRQQGLVSQRSVSLHGGECSIVTLTTNARRMLEAHTSGGSDDSIQPLHAGLVKPAELPHDAQLFALYEVAAADLISQGARIERVQLDYSLKRDYQTFLNRVDRSSDVSEQERRAWAEAHGLTLVNGEVCFPDLRIEYTNAGGDTRVHDVELVTVHYSARSIAAKRAAGFTLYRKGFTPRPHLFERLR